MEESTILGIMLMMVCLADFDITQFGTFVSDLKIEARRAILSRFQSALTYIYANEDICRWIAEFPHLLCRERLKLVSYLSSKDVEGAYQVLQISRVLILPVEIPSFLAAAKHFLASDKSDWIEECLKVLPKQ